MRIDRIPQAGSQIFTVGRGITNWFGVLSIRERLLVGGAALVGFLFLLQYSYEFVAESISGLEAKAIQRQADLQDVAQILKRYQMLERKKDELQERLEKSQLTFEQVTTELDRIVREAIGNDNYELKRPHPPTSFGFAYQKQDFSLIIRSLSLEQLVRLLYQIEQGGKPIFLNKVDITKNLGTSGISAVLEIYSIGKVPPGKQGSSESDQDRV